MKGEKSDSAKTKPQGDFGNASAASKQLQRNRAVSCASIEIDDLSNDLDFALPPFLRQESQNIERPIDFVSRPKPLLPFGEQPFVSASMPELPILDIANQNDDFTDIETHWDNKAPSFDFSNFLPKLNLASVSNDSKISSKNAPAIRTRIGDQLDSAGRSERQVRRQSFNSTLENHLITDPSLNGIFEPQTSGVTTDSREFSRTPGNVRKIDDDSKTNIFNQDTSTNVYNSYKVWNGATDTNASVSSHMQKHLDSTSTVANLNTSAQNTPHSSHNTSHNSSNESLMNSSADTQQGNAILSNQQQSQQFNEPIPVFIGHDNFIYSDPSLFSNGPHMFFNGPMGSQIPSPILIPFELDSQNGQSIPPDYLSKNAAFLAQMPYIAGDGRVSPFITPITPEFNQNIMSNKRGGNNYFKGGSNSGKNFIPSDKHNMKSFSKNDKQSRQNISGGYFESNPFSQFFNNPQMTNEPVPNYVKIIEDYRSNGANNVKLADFIDDILSLSRDQHGSRFIQIKVEKSPVQDRTQIFNKLLPDCPDLMVDVFGNYVVQKLFEFGTHEQKEQLFALLKSQVLKLSLHMYGCRVIQKAIETLPVDLQNQVLDEISMNVVTCVKDQNGNHVIQKCIESVDKNRLDFIINDLRGNVLDLSMHSYGCRVIQRLLEHCQVIQINDLLKELLDGIMVLILDQFGNYVIQHIIEHCDQLERAKIVSIVQANMYNMSRHKFASNVVEKCLILANIDQRIAMIESVFGNIFNRSPNAQVNNYYNNHLFNMMKDQYANYVIQKMIDCAPEDYRTIMLEKVRSYSNNLRKFPHGKHLLAKLERFKIFENNSQVLSKSMDSSGVNIQSDRDSVSSFPPLPQSTVVNNFLKQNFANRNGNSIYRQDKSQQTNQTCGSSQKNQL